MSNFKGYYFKIGDCNFTSPSPKRDGFEVMPHIVQTTDAGRVSSGKLIIKVLPHRPTKIIIDFPIMTPEQYKKYYSVLDDMYLSVEYYNEASDSYETATMYHTDLKYKPITYQGQRMINFEQFSLIEH
jgi:hypothetical protein